MDEHNQLDIYEDYLRTKKEKENGEALWKQVPQRVIDSVIEATIGANTIDGIFKRVDELTNGEHVDLIIVTSIFGYQEIKQLMKSKCDSIVSIEEVLSDMWNDL